LFRYTFGSANYYIALNGLSIGPEENPNHESDARGVVVLYGLTRYNQKAEFRISLLTGRNPTGSLGIDDLQEIQNENSPTRTRNDLNQEIFMRRTVEKLNERRQTFDAQRKSLVESSSSSKPHSDAYECKKRKSPPSY
jgi:hypothetical protein